MLNFPSPKTTLVVGCLLALGAHFIWTPETILHVAIAIIAWGLTDMIIPGSAGAGSHGYVVSPILAVLKVGLFFFHPSSFSFRFKNEFQIGIYPC